MKVVQPLTHDRGDHLPLFAWNLPIPRGDSLSSLRRNGTLRKHINALADRGLIPTVDLGWRWTRGGALSLATTLQEEAQPVYLLIPETELIEKWAWFRNDVWVEGTDASRNGDKRLWPCLPLADAAAGADHIASLVFPFHGAGINVTGVWYDDEALPHPWNGIFAAQKSSEECRRHYPPGVLETQEAFQRYTMQLRQRLSSAMLAAPVKKFFPNAVVGNYGDYEYVEGTAERWNLSPPVPRALGDMDVQMPSAYALPFEERRRLDGMPQIEKIDGDRVHFWRHLSIISKCAIAKQPETLLIPFMNRVHPDGTHGRPAGRHVGMSRAAFREVMRHALLRGADTFYMFNLGHHPSFEVTPLESLESLADARQVYDEMLEFREFWENGHPINFTVPDAPPRWADWARDRPKITVWSGLRLADRCLIRAYTLEDEPQAVRIEPWPGETFEVPALREPQYLILYRDGRVEPAG